MGTGDTGIDVALELYCFGDLLGQDALGQTNPESGRAPQKRHPCAKAEVLVTIFNLKDTTAKKWESLT